MAENAIRTCYAMKRDLGDPIFGDLVMTETYEIGDKTPYKIAFAIMPRFALQNGADGMED